MRLMKKILLAIALAAMAFPTLADSAKPLDILALGYYIWFPDGYKELMAKENIYLHQFRDRLAGDPALYPLELLKKFNVVIASGPLGRNWGPHLVKRLPRGMVARLLEYQKQGGSVIWIPLGTKNSVNNWNEVIGGRIGAEALDHWLTDPARTQSIYRPGASSLETIGRYTWTDAIGRHPITDGVRTLFLNQCGNWSSQGVVPMKFASGWQVLVRGAPGSTTRPVEKASAGSATKEPALVAVKDGENGSGPMAVFPLYTSGTWGNYNQPGLGNVFLFDGDDKTPSDGQRLLLNLFRHLASANSAKGFGGYHLSAPPEKEEGSAPNLKPAVWRKTLPDTSSNGRQQKGLLGARSKDGGGSGSVAEWAAAAKTAGLDFLIFVEDPAKHTHASYLKFVTACREASTRELAIVPGFGAEDTHGVFRFYINAPALPKSKSGFMGEDGVIQKPTAAVYDLAWACMCSFAGIEKMPYNPWWNWTCASCAPLVYRNGKLVDNGIERWLNECEAHTSNLFPLSMVHLNSPSEIAEAAKSAHLTVLYAKTPDQIAYRAGKAGAGDSQSRPRAYLSNGPEISCWKVEKQGFAPWRPNADRMRCGVITSSAAGIKQVKVVDRVTGKMVRDWRPRNATRFKGQFDVSSARQHVLSLEVVDNAGRTAYAAPLFNYLGSNRVWQMSDRKMGMNHFTDWNEQRTRLIGENKGPLAITYVKTINHACATNPTNPAEDENQVRGIDGGKIYMPACHLPPRLVQSGQTLERGVFQYYLRLASHDAIVIDNDASQKRIVDAHKFNNLEPVPEMTPLDYADIACRNWVMRSNLNRAADYKLLCSDLTFTFKKEVELDSIYLAHLSWKNAPREFDHWYLRPSPAADVQKQIFELQDNLRLDHKLEAGGYVYQAPTLGGATAFILREGGPVSVATKARANVGNKVGSRSNNFEIKFPGKRLFKAGETYSLSIMMATRKFDDAQSGNLWLEQMLQDYGVGRRPAYEYKLKQGRLKTINYFVDVEAEAGGVQIELAQYPLVQPLPVRVHGLAAKAIVGEYNLATKRVRIMENFEERLVAAVDPRFGDQRYYFGEFLTWDNSAVVVDLVPEDKDFQLEVHNPSAQEQVVELLGSKGFAPLTGTKQNLTLQPHETATVILKSAPGTVELVPIK
jgi:hypothetical protein